MAKFKVVAVDAQGAERGYSVEADSENDALAKVKANGLFPTKVTEVAEPGKINRTQPARSTDARGETPVVTGEYTYKMIQIPPSIAVKEGVPVGQKAAVYLEGVVNNYAQQGWEFYRIDSIGVKIMPGCLGAFLGQKPQNVEYYVVTFRRHIN